MVARSPCAAACCDAIGGRAMKLPVLQSLRGYKLSYLPRDVMAGLVVAALTIPVAMGYAQIAGLPAVYGLYASILPTAVFALVTGSRRIVFSMDSAASATTGGMVAAAGIALGSGAALRLVPALTLVASVFLVLFALTRAGRLISHVPTPVMHGFIAGISVTVIIDQIPLFIGTHVTVGSNFEASVIAIGASLPTFEPISLLLGGIALIVLLVFAQLDARLPAALLVLTVATAFTSIFHLDEHGVAVLGSISVGLPALSLPDLAAADILQLIGYGFVIALVVAVESLLALDTFAMRDGHRAHEDRELAAFGIANAVSALLGCAPCSASISRTAAGEASGGRTQVVSLTSAAAILCVVAFLAPYLYYLPQPVLGAVVIAALVQVIDFKKIRRYARHLRGEFLVFIVVALAVMACGALVGVLLGVAISFGELAYRRHRVSQLGFLGVVPDEKGYQLLGEVPGARPVAGTAICRLQGRLSFANINVRVDELSRKVEEGATVIIIIDITQVTELDATATDRIIQFIDMLHARGAEVRLVRSVALTQDDYTRFEIEHIMKKIKIYPSIDAALEKLPQNNERIVWKPLHAKK